MTEGGAPRQADWRTDRRNVGLTAARKSGVGHMHALSAPLKGVSNGSVNRHSTLSVDNAAMGGPSIVTVGLVSQPHEIATDAVKSDIVAAQFL
jgi:hypothetical protein